jgi:anthranilate phosphoribosyltransferase
VRESTSVTTGASSWPAVLQKLVQRTDLARDEVEWALSEILTGQATEAQIAGFAIGLRAKGETVAEMTALADTVVRFGERLPIDGFDRDQLVDTCGTGGDRCDTINVSTLAAVVAAGAGAPVVKHGNRSASSQCGSADVLEALGVTIELEPSSVAQCVAHAGMGFCFAPRFNPALRHAGPARRALGVATTFNFLGPLVNPAAVQRQVVGVSDPAMAERMLGVLKARGAIHAWVVFGHDGLDEITTTGPSTVYELRDGDVRVRTLDPAMFGVRVAELSALRGGDASHNAAIALRILDGEPGPGRDVVVVNAAAALLVAGLAADIAEGVAMAMEAIGNGAAARVVEGLVKSSRATTRAGGA